MSEEKFRLIENNKPSFFLPNFIEIQRKSFLHFLEKGILEEFLKINPIQSGSNDSKLFFYPQYFVLTSPEWTVTEAILKGKTYSCKVYLPAKISTKNKEENSPEWILICNLPLMTKRGHFIINGSPRVIVNQMVRSPGIYFQQRFLGFGANKKRIFYADFISRRGAWLRIQTDKRRKIWARLKKTPKIPCQLFQDALLASENLSQNWTTSEKKVLSTLYQEIYPNRSKKEIIPKAGHDFLYQKFKNPRTYDLSPLGRQQINKKLNLSIYNSQLTSHDISATLNYIEKLEKDAFIVDDIDHLKNRKVRAAGELLQNQFETGLYRLEKVTRLKINKLTNPIPLKELITTKPLNGALREFFGSSPLSQYMDQTNPLSEITHKRRLSSLGPGGINRDTAGMAVRGIHPTHYGKICPIETPEGKNAGLVNSLTIYTKINKDGFLETPYYKVVKGQAQILGGFHYFSAEKEYKKSIKIAPGDLELSPCRILSQSLIPARITEHSQEDFRRIDQSNIDYIGMSPIQMISIATALIPFLEHDDANRALMGSNMQRQAVPLIKPQRPVVGTGLEGLLVAESGHVVQAKKSGYVSYVSGKKIILQIPSKYQYLFKPPTNPYFYNFNISCSSKGKSRLKKNQLHSKLDVNIDVLNFINLSPKVVPSASGKTKGDASDKTKVDASCLVPPAKPKVTPLVKPNMTPHTFGDTSGAVKPKVTDLTWQDLWCNKTFGEDKVTTNKTIYNLTRKKQKAFWSQSNKEKISINAFWSHNLEKTSKKLNTISSNTLFTDIAKTKINVFKEFFLGTFQFQWIKKQTSLAQQKDILLASKMRAEQIKIEQDLNASKVSFLKGFQLLSQQEYSLQSYERSNQETCLTQQPIVLEGEWVQTGDLLADCSASSLGELALGKNILIAYLPWEGFNFEDAVVLSERLVSEDLYTSIHIEKYEVEIRETQYGIEHITKQNPHLTNQQKLCLNTFGIINIGQWVEEGDILVSKISPMKSQPLSPHQRLAYDLIGLPIPTTRDTSLRVPKGVQGKVINFQVLDATSIPKNLDVLGPGRVRVYLAEKRKIQVGDKVAGRHGNKGIVSSILPRQDMPYLPDGTIIDMILNPLGIPSRMNVGQVFECLLGLAGRQLNQRFKVTPFDEIYGAEASRSLVYLKLYQARLKTSQDWLFDPNFPGKTPLFDGRTGQCFHQWVTVGQAYMLKLVHLVDEKIHARSTGPYSLVTKQPLGGRAKHGGQRLGEMEVWALEGFGAAYTLQEMLTTKSDDVLGRQQILQAILNKEKISLGNPETFKILLRELQCLCLDIGVYTITSQPFGRKTVDVGKIP